MSWRELSVDEFNSLKRSTLIDVRSPIEFEAEHIPGAINVPLFTNSERDFIGKIYATMGEVVARRKGMEIIAPKIPALIDQIVAFRGKNNGPLVIQCWRGGLRSEAVASCLSIVGIDSWRLTGGYKAWRAGVVRDFQNPSYNFRLIALQGLTGVGKTEILHCLQSLGESVLDLENIAGHRGSVFGALGLGTQPGQKNFESQIWLQMRHFDGSDKTIFVEAEGKSIGRLRLPPFLFERIKSAPQILVTGSLACRCSRIVADYTACLENESDADEFFQQSLAALETIGPRLPGKILSRIKEAALSKDLHQAVELLLVHYYDFYYQKEIDKQNFVLSVCGDDARVAAQNIVNWISSSQ